MLRKLITLPVLRPKSCFFFTYDIVRSRKFPLFTSYYRNILEFTFRRVKTLEEKFIQLGNNLRSMERYEIKSNERGTEIQQKIEELQKKVAEVNEYI